MDEHAARSRAPKRFLTPYDSYYGSTPGTIFYHPDELGSLSAASDYTGQNINEKLFYPFGELWTGSALPSLGMHQEFAQLPDYDAETDQYNTLNRHYSPSGRWMSPDPGGLKVIHTDDPQTWNLYAYVRNNPTTFEDPSGLACQNSGKGNCGEPNPEKVAAAQGTVTLNIQVIRSDNLNKAGQKIVDAQIADLKADMAKIGITVNVTSDTTRSVDLKHPGSLDKGAVPYIFATSGELGSKTSASGFLGKTVAVVINEFTNAGDKVVATHETLHILRGDIYAGKKEGASWGREIRVDWETFRLEHGWTHGMGWLTNAAQSPPNQ